MKIIPIAPIPAQRFHIILGEQHCTVVLRQNGQRLYMDLWANGNAVCAGVVCVDRASITRNTSFDGSLHFFDTNGVSAPHWSSLNERFVLVYVEADEELPESLRF